MNDVTYINKINVEPAPELLRFPKNLLFIPHPNFQPERLNPETTCECCQCKLDKFHQENDLEFYNFQIERRKHSWCPRDNLLNNIKQVDAIV